MTQNPTNNTSVSIDYVNPSSNGSVWDFNTKRPESLDIQIVSRVTKSTVTRYLVWTLCGEMWVGKMIELHVSTF